MSEISHSRHQAITDAAELAFWGVEFEPIPQHVLEDNPDCAYISGSERTKIGYDPQVQCSVEISEPVGFVEEDGAAQPVRRLYAEWDNGDSYELDLENGDVIFPQEETDVSEETQELIRERLKRSLLAVMPDVF